MPNQHVQGTALQNCPACGGCETPSDNRSPLTVLFLVHMRNVAKTTIVIPTRAHITTETAMAAATLKIIYVNGLCLPDIFFVCHSCRNAHHRCIIASFFFSFLCVN